MPAAFEIDAISAQRHEGWSVLVRGTMQRVDPKAAGFAEHFDPAPWPSGERDVWLVIEPFSITGRQLHAPDGDWPFQPTAYL